MKTPTLLLATILASFVTSLSASDDIDPFARKNTASSTASSNPTITFRVSEVGHDKTMLLKVFDTLNRGERQKQNEFDGVEVSRRISDTEYLVYPLERKYRTVADSSQRLGTGGNARSIGYLSADTSNRYYLVLLSAKNMAEGERDTTIPIRKTDETFTTSWGGSYRKIEEVPGDLISREEFVARLRSGETFTIENFEEQKCTKCHGFGHLGFLSGEKDCPECGDSGKVWVNCLVVW